MISLFDVYELLPRTDCGKCIAGNCMNMAKKLSNGQASLHECSVISKNPNDYSELAEILSTQEA